MEKITTQTPQNKFEIEVYSSPIPITEVKTNKPLFTRMCKEGCKNYNMKYSCPPFSPSFNELTKDHDTLFIVLLKTNLNQINLTEYNKLRIANVVMKSKIERIMRLLEEKSKTTFLSTGSCRLCKPCKLKLKEPCAHPNKRRYSLESVGVDCNNLSKKSFPNSNALV